MKLPGVLLAVPLAVVLLVFLSAAAAATRADGGTDGAAAFIQSFGDRGISLLSDRELGDDARRDSFRDLIKSHFDLPGIGRFVLGRHWRKATKAERDEYGQLFEDYVVTSVDRKLSVYAGETLEIDTSRSMGDGKAIVKTRIVPPDGTAVRVDWWLKRRGEQWRIIDLVVEGVSLVLTQRNEFDAVIKQGGGQISPLLQRLRDQTAGSAGPPS